MKEAKVISQFSLEDIDLEDLFKQQSDLFKNKDAVILFNGDMQQIPILNKEAIYQVAEPRVILVVSGEIDVCINLQDYHLETGHILLIGSDSIIEFNEVSADARVTAIILRNSINVPEDIVLSALPVEYNRLLRMYYLVWDIIHLTPYRQKTMQFLLNSIVSNIQEIKATEVEEEKSEGATREHVLFLQFKRLVHLHCMQERSIPFYAHQLHITPHYLSAIIKKTSRQSVMYWINRAILQEAKLLLKANGLMIYEIANRMGFPSASAFSKFFKREAGMTPREYQESISK